MSAYRLLPAARRDLAKIWLYTADNWGADKAEEYLEAIRFEIEQINEFPKRHPRHASRHGDFRKARGGEHFVFYLTAGEVIDIVRILHKSMDFDSQLD